MAFAGPKNRVGPQGPDGKSGADGSRWYSGEGEPKKTLGQFGDFYLDISNGDVYEKLVKTWTYAGNIRGPKGAKGNDGQDGKQGPPGKPGRNGNSGGGMVGTGGGGTGSSDFTILQDSIPSGESRLVDSGLFADLVLVKYFSALNSADQSIRKYFEQSANRRQNEVNDTIYSILGAANIEVSFVKNGTNYELNIVNNEAVTLFYKIKKLSF